MTDPLPELSGRSEAFRQFVGDLERAAASVATVLLIGESGTGKGLAARWLHRWSPRAKGPRITTSLAALTPTLMESELFGHEVGAFTGAARARLGRFRQAHGGTLVLEDVDTLPADVQGKLLRVLQERVVEPLGAEVPVAVDVRVVATTSRDLRPEVRAGRFREDLYYRLAVVALRAPSLRERPEDLPLLAERLMERSAHRLGLSPRPFSAEACARLAAHTWPGNVRELENALERVLVLGGSPGPGSSGPGSPDPVAGAELDFLVESAEGAAGDLARRALASGLSLPELERTILQTALDESRGNLSAAARRVGLTRRAFEYRLGREGLRPRPAEHGPGGPEPGGPEPGADGPGDG